MLALVGSGEYLPDMEPVDRLLLAVLGEHPSVVCLPTAAGTEGTERINYWSALGVDHFTRLGVAVKTIPVITRQDAYDIDLSEQVRQADLVYMSGGHPDYLLQVLRDSPVWQAILDVLKRGGILAGCSAGAMIMGARIPGFPRSRPAFNLLPEKALVIPHFDEVPAWFVPVARFLTNRHLQLVGIPGFTALLVDDTQGQVLGRGGVEIWDRKGRRKVSPGETLEW
jgi:cyanophycinase